LLANLQHLFHFIFILIEKSLNFLAKTSFPAQNLSNRQRMSVIRSKIMPPLPLQVLTLGIQVYNLGAMPTSNPTSVAIQVLKH